MSKEKAIRFGPSTSLVGLVSEGEPERGTDRPAFLILNAGILHRVGPSRLHVALARRLAASGFTSLRFDFSGIGDSESGREGLPFEDRAVIEVREAMDYLSRTRGIERFVLFGLCSGADVAFQAAKAEPRVVGHVSIDGFAYRTPGYYLRYYGSRLLKPRCWASFARRQWSKAAGAVRMALGKGDPSPRPSLFERRFPPRDQAEADLATLIARGVRQLFIFSAGHERWYNHATQFERTFRGVDFRGRVRVEYFPDADHTFPDLERQGALIDAICEWATGTRFTGPDSGLGDAADEIEGWREPDPRLDTAGARDGA